MTITSLSAKELAAALPTLRFGKRLYAFDTIDSTNACAKALAGIGAEEGTLVITEHQTAGRGRLGRRWDAEPYKNLMFSLILRPSIPAEQMNLLPLYVAVGLAEGVERTTGVRPECKWPNDLLHERKKFAGILMEGSVTGGVVDFVVAGTGMNVNQTLFPPDIEDRATSLSLACHREIDRWSLFSGLLLSLESLYDTLLRDGFASVLSTWLQHSPMLGKAITVSHSGVTTRGIVKGLSKEGGLMLDAGGEERTFFAGDVTIVEM